MYRVLLFLSLLIFAGCSTPYGKAVGYGNAADMASTFYALSANENAEEANPLGVGGVMAVKAAAQYYIDTQPCNKGKKMERVVNSIFYAAAGNNVAVGAQKNNIVGALIGIGLYNLWRHHNPLSCK